jgi:purine-binding chemotaxis protein CheW
MRSSSKLIMSTTTVPASLSPSLAGKYLTVALAGESYGIAVIKVREIIRLQKITPVPHMPDFVKGVINLRGRVIPVIDLRVKFGLPAVDTERTCIVVVHIAASTGRANAMGLIVDGVEEVVNLAAGQIEPTPEFGVSIDASCLLGMAKVADRVKTLLDIERVVSAEILTHTMGEPA